LISNREFQACAPKHQQDCSHYTFGFSSHAIDTPELMKRSTAEEEDEAAKGEEQPRDSANDLFPCGLEVNCQLHT